MQSFSSSLSRTEAPSRLRLTRNPMPTVRGEQDSEFPPTPSSSSSSRSSHQDMADINNSSLTHIARASSSTDSPAARLRALTSRVLANTSSQATPPPTDRDSESDAATVKKPPASAFFTTGPARVLSGELESDIESFVGNSLPSSRASSAKQRLRDLYIRTLAANETDSTPKPPTPRRRRSSSASPEPSRNKVTPRPNSLSDDERDRKSNTPSSADKSSRKRQDYSLNILRARLESSDVNTDLEETPNINRTSHPLRSQIEAIDFSHDLPNPTPQQSPTHTLHNSFGKQLPERTSTPKNARGNDGFLTSDQSSMNLSFHPSPLQLPPSPTRVSPNYRTRKSPLIVPSVRPRLARATYLDRSHKASTHETYTKQLEEQPTTDEEALRANQRRLDVDSLRLESLIHDSTASASTSKPIVSSRRAQTARYDLQEPNTDSAPEGEPLSDEELEVIVKDGEPIGEEQMAPSASWEYGMTPLKTLFRAGSIGPTQQSTPKGDVSGDDLSRSLGSSSNRKFATTSMNLSSSPFDSADESSDDGVMRPPRTFKGKGKKKYQQDDHAHPESSVQSASFPPAQRSGVMVSPTNPQSDDLSFPPSPVSLSRVSGISVISKSEEFKTPEGTMEASQEQKAIDPSLSFIPDEPSMPSSSALPPSENESQNEEQPALNISHLSFATPPRISRSVVFNTPPRPDDLPDLPDLPTSPDGSLPSPTATRTPNRNTLIDGPGMTRTPHPPGGWRTPKPGRPHLVPATPQDESGVLEPNTAEEVNGSAVSVPNGARNKLRGAPTTPDAGFPAPTPEQDGGTMGASTSISKTPKPPGAWASTPVTSASNSLRKGILKVRFDETSLSSSAILEHQVMEEEQEELVTPSNKHRKGIPSAFGPNEGDVASSPPSKGKAKPSSRDSSPRRRRPRMKMVDAFGNEIPSSPEMLPALREEDNSPATEEEIQLLRSIARQIPLIAKEFNDESMSMTAPEPLRSLQEILEEKDRTIDLKEASKLARAERARLHRQLQLLRNGEESLSQEIGRLEGVVRAATPPPDLETVQTNRRWGKWFVMILMTQTVAIIIFVKMVSLRARYMFLTTYYDPHFPALYEPLIPTGWDISSTFGPHSLSLVDGAAHSSVLDTFLHLASEIFYSILAFFFGMKTLDFTLPPPQRLPS